MSFDVKVNEKAFDIDIDIEPVLKKASELAKKQMEKEPKLPRRRVNYAGSFYIEKEKNPHESVYVVKNREKWMDAFINNGHIVWNSTSGAFVQGTFHYNKGQEVADNYINSQKIKLKKK